MKKNKQIVKNGGKSVLLTALVIIILIAANVGAEKLGFKWDSSENKMFTLSDQTKTLLKELNSDVTIYQIAQIGYDNPQVTEMLDIYKTKNSHISVEVKDPTLYPNFVYEYVENPENLPLNSVIIVGENRYKVISYTDMMNYTQNAQTGNVYIDSINIEGAITNGIQYVSKENIPTIYTISGHEEVALDQDISDEIEKANFALKSINLANEASVPEDASCLMITNPMVDYSDAETQMILTYLDNGGSALIYFFYVNPSFTNFKKVLNAYGVDNVPGVIIETGSENYAQYPIYLLPNMPAHEITASLGEKNLKLLLPVDQGIQTLADKKASLVIEELLVTSADSYSKTNEDLQTYEFEEGDIQGPFPVAVTITDTEKEPGTKLIVIGNKDLINADVNSYSANANLEFVINSLNWLTDQSESNTIHSVPLTSEYLLVTDSHVRLWAILIILVIPFSIIGVGIFVWIRRRRR